MRVFNVITLFPEMFDALNYGITGRAIKNQLIQLRCINPRDFTNDPHRTVDDKAYGGGPGMVMRVEPLRNAIYFAKKSATSKPHVICLSPQGKKLDQSNVMALDAHQHIIFVTGRYEGIDERLIEMEVDEEWSIGDYVLSGGELAAMVMIDAITRLQPGALHDETSAQKDSFMNGLLDHPHYTRPAMINGVSVPKVLLEGNHEAIERWRLKQSLGRTWKRRPDLLEKRPLSCDEQRLLNEFIEIREE